MPRATTVEQRRPRVSIGLPVFNGEPYLSEALNSILCQTFSDFELVISDNASDDRTQEICERYARSDARIRYSRSETNLGIAPNFNRVFELCNGEYFRWASHDDVLAPTLLSRCVEILDARREVPLCYSRVREIDENGTFLRDYDPLPKAESAYPHVRFGGFILAPDGRNIQMMGLIRAHVLRKSAVLGSYPSSDEVLLAELALYGPFFEVTDRLYFYRFHSLQSTKGVLASERARVLLFDTSLRGQAVLLKWLYFRHCLLAVSRAPISTHQRARCYGHVFRWLAMRRNFQSMAKDLCLAIHRWVPLFPGIQRDVIDAAERAHHYQGRGPAGSPNLRSPSPAGPAPAVRGSSPPGAP